MNATSRRRAGGFLAVALTAGGLAAPAAAAATTCRGEVATIVGTDRVDEIEGTSGRDVIAALGGRDVVNAGGGDDLVCGGDDGDKLLGEAGADRLYGEEESDTLQGGEGDDVLDVGTAHQEQSGFVADYLFAEPGNDAYVGSGDETINRTYLYLDEAPGPVVVDLVAGTVSGAGGTDTITGVRGLNGSPGDDVFTGTAARELLAGHGGDDRISSGGGDDFVLGHAGSDSLDGGPGDDLIRPDDGGEAEPSGDTVAGGDGVDTVSFIGTGRPLTVDLAAGSATGLGTDTLSGIENAHGGEAGDAIRGDDGPNELRGDGGPDTVSGAGGDDLLNGEEQHGDDGNDVLSGTSKDNLLDVGPGSDTASFSSRVTADLATGTAEGDGSDVLVAVENLQGSDARDVLRGDAGPNVIRGGEGNDELDGRDGADALDGGDGNDVCTNGETETACELASIPVSPLGPSRFADRPCSEPGAIVGTDASEELTGTEGDDVICGMGGADDVSSLGGDDVVYGGDGADQVDGGPGRDAVDGGPGDDGITGGADDDLLRGGDGDDAVRGSEGDDVSDGGDGRDEVFGDEGNDVGAGGAGADALDGGAGSDSCIGGTGDDRYAACERCAPAAAASNIAFSRTGRGRGVHVVTSRGRRVGRVSHDVSPPTGPHDYEPAWSPDGRTLAFDGGGYEADIFTVRSSGARLRRVTNIDGHAAFTPEWSPDGGRLVFEAQDRGDESYDIYSVAATGGRVDKLTESDAGRLHPRYSPDGEHISFEVSVLPSSGRTFSMASGGGQEMELLPGLRSANASWAPSSHWLAVAAQPRRGEGAEIFLVHSSGHGAVQITDGPGSASYPEWSPDGTRIVFMRDENGDENLWVVDPAGRGERRVSGLDGDEQAPQWSPDGARIAFVLDVTEREGSIKGLSDVYSITANGDDLRRITKSAGYETSPVWQPKPCG